MNKQIQTDTLPVDLERDTPLDMRFCPPSTSPASDVACPSQYRRLFNTARIPGAGRDRNVTFQGSKHIGVICNNHIWTVDVTVRKREGGRERDGGGQGAQGYELG